MSALIAPPASAPAPAETAPPAVASTLAPEPACTTRSGQHPNSGYASGNPYAESRAFASSSHRSGTLTFDQLKQIQSQQCAQHQVSLYALQSFALSMARIMTPTTRGVGTPVSRAPRPDGLAVGKSPETLTMEKLNKKAEEKAAKAREAEDALTQDPSNPSLQNNVTLAQRKEQEALDAAAKFAEHGFNES